MSVREPDQANQLCYVKLCKVTTQLVPNGARAWEKILKQRIKTSMHVRGYHSPHDVPTVQCWSVGACTCICYVTRHVTGLIQSV